MTLIGPPTAVLRPSTLVSVTADGENQGHERNFYIGRDVGLNHRQLRENISTGQIYRFTIGRTDSPVHSAPRHFEDRIFVSVVYY